MEEELRKKPTTVCYAAQTEVTDSGFEHMNIVTFFTIFQVFAYIILETSGFT